MLIPSLAVVLVPGAVLSMILSRMFRKTYGRCKPAQVVTILFTGPAMLVGFYWWFHLHKGG